MRSFFDFSKINSKIEPAWGEVTVNTDIVTTTGVAGIQWNRRAGICIVYVNIKINITTNGQNVLLCSDIPSAVFGYEPRGVAIDVSSGRAFVLKVTNRTNLSLYTGSGAPYQGAIAGCVIYDCVSQ